MKLVPKLPPTFWSLRRNHLLSIGVIIVVICALLALSAPGLTRLGVLHDPNAQEQTGLDTDGMPLSPGKPFLLGTDSLGRDILARVIHGTRISFTVGVAAMLTASIIGVLFGVLAGYFGGKVDIGLMRFTEMCMTIPA